MRKFELKVKNLGKATTGVLAVLVVVLIALNIFQFYYFNYMKPSVSAEDVPIQITDLQGSNWQGYIGKKATVEGYYFSTRNEVPMLVSNPELPYIDEALPEDKFVRLNGTIPDELQACFGDKLHVKGTVQQSPDSEEKNMLSFESYSLVAVATIHRFESGIHVVITGPILALRNKFAVLISGGVNSGMAYMRYWNDVKYMYSILINAYDYVPGNIYVIYKDGVGEDTEIPVNYSATFANVQTVFNALKTRMGEKDILFIYTNNHGSPTGLCLYYNQEVTPSQLATMLSGFSYYRMIIFMKQCFSGIFIPDLSGPRRVIMTACTPDQISYCNAAGTNGEFSIHFMQAVNGEVPADTNANGVVSMAEAFNWASTHDSRPETPQYDDNADGVGHTAIIPNSGDGTLGGGTYL